MKNYYFNTIGLALIFMCFFSCSSDLNFNQVNDLKLTPVVEGNLSYFDIPATDFVVAGSSKYNFGFDVEDFDIFRDKYFNSYLQKASFYFEITNTINRAFKSQIVLLDANKQVVYTIPFDIPAYSGTENIVTKTVLFEGPNLDLLKRSRNMGFGLEIQAGPALNSNSAGSLKLRSSATVYLEIQ